MGRKPSAGNGEEDEEGQNYDYAPGVSLGFGEITPYPYPF